jgi:hypothetical protein
MRTEEKEEEEKETGRAGAQLRMSRGRPFRWVPGREFLSNLAQIPAPSLKTSNNICSEQRVIPPLEVDATRRRGF